MSDSSASALVTKNLSIPTIGIGSSSNCDGQILVTDDMLGISGFYPKFVKKYASLDTTIEKAVKKYTRDVKKGKFPLKKTFLMEQNLDNKIDLKSRIINFYNENKLKIQILLIGILILFIVIIFCRFITKKK